MYDTTTQGHVAERTTANDLPIASTSPLPADQERTPSPRRILFVTARYFPLIGGTETHTFEIARRMKMLGHDVTVLTTNPGRRLPAEEVVGGVPVIRVPAWPIDRDYYFAPSLVRVIKDGQWDIVHCQGYHTLVAPLAMFTARLLRIPYFVSFHSGGYSASLRNVIRSTQSVVLRPLLARAERLFAVSRFEARLFQRRLHLPPGRIVLVPNGSDLPMQIEAIPVAEPPLLISIGRLEAYKGHHRVILALPALLAEYPTLKLRIVGAGPYEAALWQLAHELGVADHVTIAAIPPEQRQEMAQLLSSAALVVLLSDYESQGIAALEAVALGRPVLVANGTALLELVEKKLARGVPMNATTDELVLAIRQQLEHPLIPEHVHLPTWNESTTILSTLYERIPVRYRRIL